MKPMGVLQEKAFNEINKQAKKAYLMIKLLQADIASYVPSKGKPSPFSLKKDQWDKILQECKETLNGVTSWHEALRESLEKEEEE